MKNKFIPPFKLISIIAVSFILLGSLFYPPKKVSAFNCPYGPGTGSCRAGSC